MIRNAAILIAVLIAGSTAAEIFENGLPHLRLSGTEWAIVFALVYGLTWFTKRSPFLWLADLCLRVAAAERVVAEMAKTAGPAFRAEWPQAYDEVRLGMREGIQQ